MAIMPCNTHVNCPGFDGSPVINNSSEAPDVLTFLGEAYGPNYNPPLGWQWDALTDYVVCTSPVSQAAADQCAQDGSVSGTTGTWVPPEQQSRPDAHTFKNSAQQGMVDCPDGLPYFYDVPAGMFTGGTQAAADQAAVDWGNQQAILHQLCFSDIASPVCQGAALSVNIFASSAFLAPPGSNVWEVTSGPASLPPGLTLNSTATGPASLTGTPTTPGDYDFVIGVTLPNGDFSQKEFFVTVAGITNPALPDATVGTPYNASLLTIGFSSPVFSVTDTGLPDGLAMDSAGNISGTPAVGSTGGTFTVVVRDGVTSFECNQDITINFAVPALNFNDLVWDDPPDTANPHNGTLAFSNVGATVDIQENGPPLATNPGPTYQNVATMNYVGPDTTGNLQVTITGSGPYVDSGTGAGIASWTATLPDGTVVGAGPATFPLNPSVNGVYNFPFPVTAGVQNVALFVTCRSGPNDTCGSFNVHFLFTPEH